MISMGALPSVTARDARSRASSDRAETRDGHRPGSNGRESTRIRYAHESCDLSPTHADCVASPSIQAPRFDPGVAPELLQPAQAAERSR